jgi:hypothetical protein
MHSDKNAPETKWDAGMMGGKGEEEEVGTYGAASIQRNGNVKGGCGALPCARAGFFSRGIRKWRSVTISQKLPFGPLPAIPLRKVVLPRHLPNTRAEERAPGLSVRLLDRRGHEDGASP